MAFVILEHELPQSHPRAGVHFDLMLEHDGRLLTWALDEAPRVGEEGSGLPCQRLPDHRVMYLDYEGPVSGDRGEVRRWDRGECELLEQGDQRVRARIEGERVCATVTLTREQGEQWLAEFREAP